MSQHAARQPARPGAVPPQPRRAFVTREELNPLPTVRGVSGALAFVKDRLGVPVTRNKVRLAIEAREMPVYRIDRWNYTAERDLYDWIMSLAKVSRRSGGDAA